jgi:hypothetical protein
VPDITKCLAIGCERRHTCYRYISQPYHFQQSYFTQTPLKEDGSCDYYWEHKPKKKNDRRTETKTED